MIPDGRNIRKGEEEGRPLVRFGLGPDSPAMRRLFEKVDTVIFEGPLDQASLDHVARIGQTPETSSPRLMDAMSEETVMFNCLDSTLITF